MKQADETAAMIQYKRAPITEAVIEIRFEQELPKESIDKLHQRLRGDYAASEQISSIGFEFNVQQRQATARASENGYKLVSKDQADILLITPASMACSRLAPYNGWKEFRERANNTWKTWKRVTGYRKIQRLGVRYINRIDIPAADEEKITVDNFLKVYPEYPDPIVFSVLSKYTMQITGNMSEENYSLIINSGIIPSPILNHISLILDLDLAQSADVPQRDDEIWATFDNMRMHKNRIFESCITDNARKLFDE